MDRKIILELASKLIFEYLNAYKLLPEGSQKETLYSSNFIEGLIYRCIFDVCLEHGIKLRNNIDRADYITSEALSQINEGNNKNLVFEHMIPKISYFNIVVKKSKANLLTETELSNLLKNNYWSCIVTKNEDAKLGKEYKSKMPHDWDKIDIFARYTKVGIIDINANDSRKLK